jgi:hypothetical protein
LCTRIITLPLPQPAAAFYDALRPGDPTIPIVGNAVDVSVPARSAAILLPDTP